VYLGALIKLSWGKRADARRLAETDDLRALPALLETWQMTSHGGTRKIIQAGLERLLCRVAGSEADLLKPRQMNILLNMLRLQKIVLRDRDELMTIGVMTALARAGDGRSLGDI